MEIHICYDDFCINPVFTLLKSKGKSQLYTNQLKWRYDKSEIFINQVD
jgi:hypothetical protein